MKKKAGVFFAIAFIAVLIISMASILDASLDLNSEHTASEVDERLEIYRNYIERKSEKGEAQKEYAEEYAKISEEMLALRQNSPDKWVGVSIGEAAKAKLADENFDLDIWLASVERNTVCDDCPWFSVIAYTSEAELYNIDNDSADILGTEICPNCGKVLWKLGS